MSTRYVWSRNNITYSQANGPQATVLKSDGSAFTLYIATSSSALERSSNRVSDSDYVEYGAKIANPSSTERVGDWGDEYSDTISPQSYISCGENQPVFRTPNENTYIRLYPSGSAQLYSTGGHQRFATEIRYRATQGSSAGTVSNSSSGAYPLDAPPYQLL